MRLAALIALAVLCGCTPASPPASTQTEAAPPSPLASDLDIIGEQNGWKVLVSNETKMSDFHFPSTSPAWMPNSTNIANASYPAESKAADGSTVLTVESAAGTIVMTLKPGACEDRVSDRLYVWQVAAQYEGQTLKGCAAPKRRPSASSRARMRLGVDLHQPRCVDAGIDLGGGEAGMAQQRLDRTQVAAIGQKVRRE